jgi:hypothetical protein
MDGFDVNNLTMCIIESLLQKDNFGQDVIATKLISFYANEMNIFQGLKIGVTIEIHKSWVLFSLGVHLFSQHIDL